MSQRWASPSTINFFFQPPRIRTRDGGTDEITAKELKEPKPLTQIARIQTPLPNQFAIISEIRVSSGPNRLYVVIAEPLRML